MLPKDGCPCVWYTVRQKTTTTKCQSLEQGKVYCTAMQEQVACAPHKMPELLKGSQPRQG